MKLFKLTLLSALILGLAAGCISPELRTARIAMNERDYDRAMSSAKAELARMPGSAEPIYMIGHIYEIRSDWYQMVFWYDSCAKVSNQYRDKITDVRRRLMARYFKKATDVSTDSLVQIYGTAVWDTTLTFLDTAIVLDPNEIALYQQGATAAYFIRNFGRAIDLAEKAVSLEGADKPPDIGTREVLLISYQETKNLPKVKEWAKNLMRLADPDVDSTNANTYLRGLDALVSAQESEGLAEEAAATLREAMAKFPHRTDIKMNLAYMALRKKDYDGCKALYKEVIVQEPNNFDANLNLGTLLANEDKWKECVPFLLKALEQKPDNRIAITNLMAAYYNDGLDAKGLEMKKRLDALSDSPDAVKPEVKNPADDQKTGKDAEGSETKKPSKSKSGRK